MSKINRLLICFVLISFGTQAQIQFLPYIEKPTGSDAEVVAIGDVNNDGKNDVVVGTSYSDNSNDYKILVFRQNSNGTLSNATGYNYLPSEGEVNSIDIADLNLDGRKDVIIGCGTLLKIFRQNNSGNLNTPLSIDTQQLVTSIKCSDLNNDSKTDIAVSYWNNDYISVYYQTTVGNFIPQTFSLPNTMTTKELVIGDVNNDSKKDIIVNSNFPSGIYTFIQNTSNAFNNPIFTAISDTQGLSIGDLNNDAKVDIAYSKGGNRPDSKIGILYQNNTPQLYDIPVEIAAYDIPEPIEIADLNNDSKNEIVTTHGGWLKASVFQQNNNVFSNYSLFEIPYASHYTLQGMAVGDINNDGKKDITIVDYGNRLIILYNSSTLGTNESIRANIQIYPNPASNYLNILNENMLELKYTITDINGKLLDSNTSDNNTQIDISQLKKGFYFLTLQNDQEKTTFKFIKN